MTTVVVGYGNNGGLVVVDLFKTRSSRGCVAARVAVLNHPSRTLVALADNRYYHALLHSFGTNKLLDQPGLAVGSKHQRRRQQGQQRRPTFK